jgi:hypothetical protein
MKRIAWLLMALALVVSCSGPAKQAEGLEPSRRRANCARHLADFPPYEFHIQQNGADKIVGFDIAVGQEIAKDLGVAWKSRYEVRRPPGALDSGNVDIVVAGMSPTENARSPRIPPLSIIPGNRASSCARRTRTSRFLGVLQGKHDRGPERRHPGRIAKKQVKGMATTRGPSPGEELPSSETSSSSSRQEHRRGHRGDGVAKAYAEANPDLFVAPVISRMTRAARHRDQEGQRRAARGRDKTWPGSRKPRPWTGSWRKPRPSWSNIIPAPRSNGPGHGCP